MKIMKSILFQITLRAIIYDKSMCVRLNNAFRLVRWLSAQGHLPCKSDDLNSIPGDHVKMEGEN